MMRTGMTGRMGIVIEVGDLDITTLTGDHVVTGTGIVKEKDTRTIEADMAMEGKDGHLVLSGRTTTWMKGGTSSASLDLGTAILMSASTLP